MNIPTFRLERYFARHEFSAPYLLAASDCESFTIKELLDMESGAEDAFRSLNLGYTESQGAPELRECIASVAYNDLLKPGDVLVHSGAEEAIFNFVHSFLQKGDHIVVHWPCYQSLHDLAAAIGCSVTGWVTLEDDGWELDMDFLKKHIRPNTKAVIVNCPHNPTGYMMQKEQWLELDRLSEEHGFVVFSDEVYRFLEYDDARRMPPFATMNDRAVSMGVMSKSLGLAGLRIGWIATKNEEVLNKMTRFKDYTTICNSAPSEFLAALALRKSRRLIGRNKAIVTDNLEKLDRFIQDHASVFKWIKPSAGPIGFPSLADGSDASAFCDRLLAESGVLLLPGAVYHEDYGSHFRIGFGRKNFEEGLSILDDYLKRKM